MAVDQHHEFTHRDVYVNAVLAQVVSFFERRTIKQSEQEVLTAHNHYEDTGDDTELSDLWEDTATYLDDYFTGVQEHGLYGVKGAFTRAILDLEEPALPDSEELARHVGRSRAFSKLEYTPR